MGAHTVLRSPRLQYTTVCVNDIHTSTYTHSSVFVDTFLLFLSLFLSHTSSHTHACAIKLSTAVISSLMWGLIYPLRALYQSSVCLSFNEASELGEPEYLQCWETTHSTQGRCALYSQKKTTTIKVLFTVQPCLQCNTKISKARQHIFKSQLILIQNLKYFFLWNRHNIANPKLHILKYSQSKLCIQKSETPNILST